MTFLLDVNVLMALLWENHEHHQVARPWFRQVTFATCPVTQLGFARVGTQAQFALATFDESLASTFSQETDLIRLIR